MSKQIVTASKMQAIAKETITEIAEIVKATLGPGGRPIVLKRDGNNPDGTPKTPLITKDGVTVAEAIQFSDPIKNTIAQTIIQVAKDTVNEAGDGTSTSILLAEAIYKAGLKYTDQGQNNIALYEDLKEVRDSIIEYIEYKKKDVNVDSIYKVAEISANGDKEIAKVVTEAIEAVGEDGHISLEEGSSRDTILEIVEGAMYKQGYRNFGAQGSLMISDKARDLCELTDAAVFLYNGKLDNVVEVAQFIGRIYQAEGNQINDPFPLLIVANDFSDEVKNMLLANRIQAKLPIAAIKTPFDGSPNARTGILEDLAILTGATVAAKGIREISTINQEHLGGCDKIEVLAQETVFYNGSGSPGEIIDRVNDLKKLLDQTPHEYDKGNLRIRIGKLTGGIAVIKVGGDSEFEIGEKKDRIEDALCAAKVALQDGIVEGGGMTLLKWSTNFKPSSDPAVDIMLTALKAPFNQIITNTGLIPEVVLNEIQQSDGRGFNARTKQVVKDMFEEGIIDPAKVAKSAIENAVSIAGLLLTTGGMVTDAPSDNTNSNPNPLNGLMGG